MKRPVRFGLTLTEKDRELADRLAREQGVSRTELIARALHLMESVTMRAALTRHDHINGKE